MNRPQYMNRFKIGWVNLISLTMITVFVIMIPVTVHASNDTDSEEVNSEMTNQERIDEVKRLVSEFEREEAYYMLKELRGDVSADTEYDVYMEMLSLLVSMEYHYWLIGDLTVDAIELYRLSSANESFGYEMQALAMLAYIEYYNYNNEDSLEQLNALMSIAAATGDDGYMVEYYSGMANLLVDKQDYEGADRFYHMALTSLETGNKINKIHYNQAIEVYYGLASTAYYMDNYAGAVSYIEKSLEEVPSNDYESLVNVLYPLVEYYIYNEEYEEAKLAYYDLFEAYENTGDLYRDYVTPKNVRGLEADIAYYEGDFELSATLYQEINYAGNDEDDDAYLTSNVVSQEALNDFEDTKIEAKFDIYEQLKNSQDQMIKVYQMGIMIALALMAIILIGVYFLLGQRKKLHKMSYTDQLTNISNRRHVMELYEKLEPGTMCVALLDLDYFKKINDTYGHVVGDRVLVKVTQVIEETLGASDVIGRYGGEEFLVLMDTPSLDEAKAIAETICRNVESIVWTIDGLKVTISIGLVCNSYESGDQLLKIADEQLYRAKANGRNQYAYPEKSR